MSDGLLEMAKTLFVAHNFPPITGGISHVMLTLCQSLPPDDVVVLAPWGTNFKVHDSLNVKDRETTKRLDETLDFKVYRSWYSARSKFQTALSILIFCARTLWLTLREKPDIVYFSHPYPTALIGLVVRLLGRPYVVHTHGSELIRPRTFAASRLRRLAMRKASRVVCTSNWGKDVVVRLGVSPGSVFVMNPKLDMAKFQKPAGLDAFKQREGLAGKKVVLTVGHIIRGKGQHLVIEGMPEIARSFPDAVYVVAGTGPDVESLKRLASERGIADRVVFPGNRDIVSFYHACDVFILPSLYESFGIVYIEAGACGKPVIGTNNGGVADAVADGESGLLVETGNVEAIVWALKKLLADVELRERLGRQGYERVLREFTVDRLREELRELTESLERDRLGR